MWLDSMENRFHDQDQGNPTDRTGESLGELYGISHVPSTKIFVRFGENVRDKRLRVQQVHLQCSPAGPPFGSGYNRRGNWPRGPEKAPESGNL